MVSLKKSDIEIKKSDALLITDIQNDFLSGGALPVPNGDEIIPVLNAYTKRFESIGFIFASRDWHPPNHCSFIQQGGPWPTHCVQDTDGAKFSPNLKLPDNTIIISKATDPDHESYSVFDRTNFVEELRNRGIQRIFIGGLATDYCVVSTVIDAIKLGFEAVVLLDATMGINVKPGDVDRAIAKMSSKGAEQVTTTDFPDTLDGLSLDEDPSDILASKSSEKAVVKKKARMRPRGPTKRIPTEK